MEIFKNNFLMKLVATICLVIMLFSFASPGKVYAVSSDDETWGGVLIKPVVKLFTAIADGIMEVLHKNIYSQEFTFVKIEGQSNWWTTWGAKVLGVIIGIIIVATAITLAISTGRSCCNRNRCYDKNKCSRLDCGSFGRILSSRCIRWN